MDTEVAIAPMADLAQPANPVQKMKKPKEKKRTKAKLSAKPMKHHYTHPSYLQMTSEAIASLRERTGSSQQAISKYLEGKYTEDLPPTFRKLLLVQLKSLTKQGKLVRVKNSFKLSDELKTGYKKASAKPHEMTVKKTRAGARSPKRAKRTVKSLDKMSKSPRKVVKSTKPAKSTKAARASKLVKERPASAKLAGAPKPKKAMTARRGSRVAKSPKPSRAMSMKKAKKYGGA